MANVLFLPESFGLVDKGSFLQFRQHLPLGSFKKRKRKCNHQVQLSLAKIWNSPSRLEISELCIFGLSCAILRRWPLDHTMKAFMGLLM